MEDAFARYYAALVEPQRKAADWGDGAFLLLAGPGSGKTRVLTARLARLIRESEGERFRVLALTFTNQAALEMADRLDSLIPNRDERSFIGTFHSFCAEILRQHGSHVGVRPDFEIVADDRDRQRIFRRAISDVGLNEAVDELASTNTRVLPLVDRLKALGVLPGESAQRFKDGDLGDTVAACYAAYEAALTTQNRLDFNSVILKTYELFKSYKGVARTVRAVYRYWALDEFQDTNELQFKVLDELAGDFRNIFVVADDDQIIYQWNGASYQRLEQLVRRFEPQIYQLPTNFRCPARIVDAANELIRHNKFRHRGKSPLESNKVEESKVLIPAVELKRYPDQQSEAEGNAEAAIAAKADEQTVAVLARNKYLLQPIKNAIDALGGRARIIERRSDFLSAPYRLFYLLLKLSVRNLDNDTLREVVDIIAALTGIPVLHDDVIARANAAGVDLFSTLINEVERVGEKMASSPASEWVIWLSRLKERQVEPSSFAEAIVNLCGADTDKSQPDLKEDSAAWKALQREIRASAGRRPSLDRYLQELDMRSKEAPMDGEEIGLLTIHAAKGKEFDQVFLVGVVEGLLPSWQSLKKGDASIELEEERRSCFVAITRTRMHLHVSYADKYDGWKKEPSRFLSEMGLM